MSLDCVRLGHLRLARLDLDAAAQWVLEQARAKHPCVVVTSNIHHLRLSEENEAFRAAVSAADLNLADGWPLVVGVRLVGDRLSGRVAGVDLVAKVLGSSGPFRIALLGGAPGAAELYVRRYGGAHEFVYVNPLPPGRWESDERRAKIVEEVRSVRPTVTLIAIGAPKQELLALELLTAVRGPIICCGAAVEILAGVRRRAPQFVQALGLEWAFRMMLEPRRLAPRYLGAGAAFVRIMVREFLRRRLRTPH